ncbi:MAG: xanthine dehydrogenase family protein molybdopterin-binding subunit [Deltaproteobacteria bacterium]|nr:xanthine dehydrogenase family protein molybdopterin-binding subunit [Deltaproteobacteria bacterium]
MKEGRVLGTPAPRVEGEEKVSGLAKYAADKILPGMLWVKALRSPISHGRIKRVDTAKAEACAGVKAVVTGRDVKGSKIGKKIIDMPILADGVVRFIGEKVAAVAADSEEIAEQALDLIEVEYEELEPVSDALEALKPSAPILHPELPSYGGLLYEIKEPSNVFVHLAWKKGDIEAGFRQSDRVIENTFRTSMAHQGYIEPHAFLVKVNDDGGAEIWASTKSPYALRGQVGAALKVPPTKLVVHPCYIGGDFGGKGDANDIALCYVLSKKSGRPVKMLVDYNEEFMAGNPRHAAVITIRTGVKKTGEIVSHHIRFVFDSGAYGSYRPQGFLVGAHESVGPYKIAHALIEEDYVYTNKVPCGYMRAPGHAQGVFATESQMDLVARELGMDPAEFRRRNFMHDGDDSPLGHMISHVKVEETLRKALEVSGYHRPKPKNVGRGIAVAQWVSKGGESYAFVKVDGDGSVTLSSAVMEVGPGAHTIMQQIVAEELKIPFKHVRVEPLDTSKVIMDTGVRGSSSTRVHGSAAYEAAKNAKEQILKAASELIEAPPEQLILHPGGVSHARAEKKISFGDIVRAKGGPIIAEGHYNNMMEGPESSTVTQVAEVAVDSETGEVSVRQLTTAHNTGAVLNPLGHQGQIDGGVIMGMGYGKMEELRVDETGRVVTANFGDYKIPSIGDIPVLKTAVMESNTGSGPYGSMSIGETAIMPTAAAIANAVYDAVGVRIKSLPVTAEKVLEALKSR